jgi:hypothetical protein
MQLVENRGYVKRVSNHDPRDIVCEVCLVGGTLCHFVAWWMAIDHNQK